MMGRSHTFEGCEHSVVCVTKGKSVKTDGNNNFPGVGTSVVEDHVFSFLSLRNFWEANKWNITACCYVVEYYYISLLIRLG